MAPPRMAAGIYTPELNDIERCWRDLKQHYLANRTVAEPMLSNAQPTTPSPVSTTSDNLIPRKFSYRLLLSPYPQAGQQPG